MEKDMLTLYEILRPIQRKSTSTKKHLQAAVLSFLENRAGMREGAIVGTSNNRPTSLCRRHLYLAA